MATTKNSSEGPRRIGPSPIDDYLAGLPAKDRAALQKLRRTIRAAAPGAEEVISYQIPTFRLGGMLVGFAAFKDHCTLFLLSTRAMKAHARELEGYSTTKSGIHFTADDPLPAALVTRLVKARLAEVAGRRKKSSG